MQLDQFNKGIIWFGGLFYHNTGLTAFACYASLALSMSLLKTKFQIPCSLKQPAAMGTSVDPSVPCRARESRLEQVVCRQLVTHHMGLSHWESSRLLNTLCLCPPGTSHPRAVHPLLMIQESSPSTTPKTHKFGKQQQKLSFSALN